MALCPFAIQKIIPPGANDPRITPNKVILHVAVSRSASLWDYFAHRSGGIESHFYIRFSGKIEQYRDTDYEADANYLANPKAISIETAGFGNGKWNKRQLRSIKRLIAWLHEVHPDIPLVKCPDPYGAGVGYHTQFGAPSPWTPVAKSCPGPNRITQFNDVIVPWLSRRRNMTPLTWHRLAIVTANLWKDNQHIEEDLTVLANCGADIIGVQEDHRFQEQLKNLPGLRYLHGKHGTGILVRDGIKVLEHREVRLSRPIGSSPGRHAQWIVYELNGKTRAHINAHWNAGVQAGPAKPKTIPRVREFIRGAKATRDLYTKLAHQHPTTITGDLNWAWSPGRRQWLWSPKVVFSGLGLSSVFDTKFLPRPKGDRRAVEYIFYSQLDLALWAQEFVPGEHSDHPWHKATFHLLES